LRGSKRRGEIDWPRRAFRTGKRPSSGRSICDTPARPSSSRCRFPRARSTEGSIATVAERFHEAHRQRYGHAYEEESIELVTIRLRARGAVSAPSLAIEDRSRSIDDAVRETREVIYDGETHEARIYDGTRLPVGASFPGPAVIEGAQSTTVLPPSQRITVDEYGTLLIEVFPDE